MSEVADSNVAWHVLQPRGVEGQLVELSAEEKPTERRAVEEMAAESSISDGLGDEEKKRVNGGP